MRTGPIVGSTLGALILCEMCCLAAVCGADVDIEKHELLVFPEDYREGSLSVSEDGLMWAYVAKADGGQRVVTAEEEGRVFSTCTSLTFSPVSNRLFYWALDESTGEQRIVLATDTDIIPTEYAAEGALRFSPNGDRWATVGGLLETREGDSIIAGKVVVLCDGRELGRYDDASYPSFSPDGEHVAYLAILDGHSVLVVDGSVIRTYEDPEVKSSFLFRTFVRGPNMHILYKVRYLSDNSLLVLTQDRSGWTVYKNEEPLVSYIQNIWGGGSLRIMTFSEYKEARSILAYSLTAAEGAPAAAWWERLEGAADRWRVVRDG